MESLCGISNGQIHRPLFSLHSRSSPRLSYKPRQISIRASSSSPRITPLNSLLKPACVALVAGAAFFLARFHKPKIVLAVETPAQTVQFDDISENISEDEKIKFLEEFLDSNPDDIKALRSLMELKIKTHKLPEAIDIVDRLTVLEPGEKDLPLLKAHLQSYDGKTATAKVGFEDMLKKDPTLVEAYHGLVMATWQSEGEANLSDVLKRIESAMEVCKEERKFGDLRDFKLLVAQVRVLEGNYLEAIRVYQDLVKEEPRDFRPYLCQGIVYSLMHKKDEAEKQFQKYRQLVPKEHPYAQYFDENMVAMKVFSQIDDNRRTASLSR